MALVYLGCAWLLGIYLASRVHLAAWVPGVAAALCLGASLLMQRARRARPEQLGRLRLGSLCLAALALGMWRYEVARPLLAPGPLAAYNDGEPVTLRGIVVNDPVPRDRVSNLHLSAQQLKADDSWLPTAGLALVQAPSYMDYRYGDEMEVRGKLQSPSDAGIFSYRAYLARQGIHSLLAYPSITILARGQGNAALTFLYSVKRRTQGVIAAILPEPEAALLSGILLGSDEGIPRSLLDQFRAVGTAHIIAISGFNITIISAALVKLLNRFLQRYAALVAAIGLIALYTVLVGAEPPVVRAAIMGGLAALALIVGRRSDALVSLVVAAWLMTAWHPFALWDVSFQISFIATLGLIVYLERLQRGVARMLGKLVALETAERLTQLLRESLLATSAAQITVLPLIAYHFGQFSPLALLANLLVLPVQPMIMYLGSTAALVGLAFLPTGQLLGWAAWLFLAYTVGVTELLSRWASPANAAGRLHPSLLIAYYVLLAWLTLRPAPGSVSLKSVARLLRAKVVQRASMAALVIVLMLVWMAVFRLPDGRLHVTFLDVGQGDAILIHTPCGHRILIDGGPSPALVLQALGRRLPIWDRRIDLVLLTHPHDDHLRGLLDVVARYQVRQVLESETQAPSSLAKQWQQALQDQCTPHLSVASPLHVDLGDGPVMQIFPAHVQGEENWLVMRLSWHNVSFLFTGDLEADELFRLANEGWPLSCTVLKVPHHGSDDSLNEPLLTTLQPQLAVISVGADNRFAHPAPSTLELLAQAGVQTLRTDQAGDIEVTVDQSGWRITGGRH